MTMIAKKEDASMKWPHLVENFPVLIILITIRQKRIAFGYLLQLLDTESNW